MIPGLYLRVILIAWMAAISAFCQAPPRVATLERAAKLICAHDASGAEEALQRLLEKSPDDPLALNLMGLVRLEQKQPEQAEALFSRAIEKGPHLAGPHVNLAMLYGAARPEDANRNYKPGLKYKEGSLLVRNTGRGFVDVSKDSGQVFAERWVGRGLAVGDLDNDGRLDLAVTANDGPAYVLHNEKATSNHWLILKLAGHKNSRDGIGATIKVETAHGSQWQFVSTAGSWGRAMLCLGPRRVLFSSQ